MSDLIKTLKSSSTGDDVYPNIKEDNIPSGAVTSAKIGTSAVTTGKINDGAVTTNKVNDGAITYEKLALALKNLIDGKASNYDLSLVQSALNTHVGNTSNPHSVTKAQVGLGNVDNTSDANKPVSTATQTALDLKADKSTTYTKTEVDTALSGKASLSGDNTFTGDNTHSGSEYFNSTIECNANDIYFVDESKNFADWMNDKQNKLSIYQIIIGDSNESVKVPMYAINNANLDNYSGSDLNFDFDQPTAVDFESANNLVVLYEMIKSIFETYGNDAFRFFSVEDNIFSISFYMTGTTACYDYFKNGIKQFGMKILKNNDNYSVDTATYTFTDYMYVNLIKIV